MDEQEWMRRVDRRLEDIERSNENNERGNETLKDYMREGREMMARLDDTMERHRIAFEDLRTYLAQATTILGGLLAEIRAGEQNHEVWREESRSWRRETREWHRALGEKMDRFQGEPPPAAA